MGAALQRAEVLSAVMQVCPFLAGEHVQSPTSPCAATRPISGPRTSVTRRSPRTQTTPRYAGWSSQRVRHVIAHKTAQQKLSFDSDSIRGKCLELNKPRHAFGHACAGLMSTSISSAWSSKVPDCGQSRCLAPTGTSESRPSCDSVEWGRGAPSTQKTPHARPIKTAIRYSSQRGHPWLDRRTAGSQVRSAAVRCRSAVLRKRVQHRGHPP